MTTDEERLAAIRAEVERVRKAYGDIPDDVRFLLAMVDKLKAERDEALALLGEVRRHFRPHPNNCGECGCSRCAVLHRIDARKGGE